MTAYYNEIDRFSAQWLRNLIDAKLIAPGDVDERSIEDVRPDDLSGFVQCHFFAGIGVWSHSLRLAGWCDTRQVWTGSCPCQPFSAAGKGAGFADERHLWPAWFHLISERKPPVIFGEQVARKDGLAWLDLVQADLEGLGYACGAVVAPAAGFGAPHIRERQYWAAYSESCSGKISVQQRVQNKESFEPGRRGRTSRLGNPESKRRKRRENDRDEGWWKCSPGQTGTFIPCTDGKSRPIEPGTFPLVDGTPARVGRLRAYGNAICAPQAQAFIEAAMEYAP